MNPITQKYKLQSNVITIGAVTDSITVPVDLSMYGAVEIHFDLILNNVTSPINFYGYVNGDETNGNYASASIQVASGGAIVAADNPFMGSSDAGYACKLIVQIKRDALGFVRMSRQLYSTKNGTIWGDIGFVDYELNSQEVTSFKLKADQTDAFLAQSTYFFFQEMSAPVTEYSSALLHFDGSDESTTITESAIFPKTWTAAGDAALDTAQFVFGTASLYLQGAGSISTPDHPAFAIGIGDFMFDVRVRVPSVPTGGNSYAIFQKGNLSIGISASNLDFTIGAGPTVISRTWTPTVDTWYALRIARKNGVIKFFVDGTGLGATEANTENGTTAQDAYIGDVGGGGAPYTGWIDEFRLIRYCDSLDDYTPAVEAFTN